MQFTTKQHMPHPNKDGRGKISSLKYTGEHNIELHICFIGKVTNSFFLCVFFKKGTKDKLNIQHFTKKKILKRGKKGGEGGGGRRVSLCFV